MQQCSEDHPSPLPPAQGGSVFKRLDHTQSRSLQKAHLASNNIPLDEPLRPSIMDRLGRSSLRRPEGNQTVKPLYPNSSPAPAVSLPDLRDELNARHGSSLRKSSPHEQKSVGRGHEKEKPTPFTPGEGRKPGVLSTFGEPSSKEVREGNGAVADVILRKSVRGGMKRTNDDSERGRILVLKKQNIPSSSNNASQLHSIGSRGYLTRSQTTHLEKQGAGLVDNRHSVGRKEVTSPECMTRNGGIKLEKAESELRDGGKFSLTRKESTCPERQQQYVTKSQSALLKKENPEPKNSSHSLTRTDATCQERLRQDLTTNQSTLMEKQHPELKNSRPCVTREEATCLERQPRYVTRSQSTQLDKQDSKLKSSKPPVTRKEHSSLEKQPEHVTRTESTKIEKQGAELKSSRHPLTRKETICPERQSRYATTSQSTHLEKQDSVLKNSRPSVAKRKSSVPERDRQCITQRQSTHLEQQHVKLKDGRHSVTQNKASLSEKQDGERVAESKSNVHYVTRSRVSLRGKQDSSPGSSGHVPTNTSVGRHEAQDDYHSDGKTREEKDSASKKTSSEQIDAPSSKTLEHLVDVSLEKSRSNTEDVPQSLERPSLEATLLPAPVVPQEASVEKIAPVGDEESEEPYLCARQHHDPLMEVDLTLSGSLPFADFDSTDTVSVDAPRTTPSNSASTEAKSCGHLVCHTASPTRQQMYNITSSQVEGGPSPLSKSVPETPAQFEVSSDIDGTKSAKEDTVERRHSPVSVGSEEKGNAKEVEKDKAQVDHNNRPTKLHKETIPPAHATAVQSTAGEFVFGHCCIVITVYFRQTFWDRKWVFLCMELIFFFVSRTF